MIASGVILGIVSVIIGYILGRCSKSPPKAASVLLLPLLMSGCGFEIVDTGHRGIETRFGKVQGESLPEGLHFYNPFTSNIIEMNVMEQKKEATTPCFTKDTQTVTVVYAITYYLEKSAAHTTYEQFGLDWDTKIVDQVVIGSIKDVIGSYIADDLVQNRDKARIAAQTEVSNSLKERHVILTRLDFTNLDFDDAYEKAVENKVVAIQKAAEAKNKTVEIEEQAKQTIKSATADAEAMRIKSQALAQNKGLVQYEAVKRWDGKLPSYMFGAGTMPMINLESLKKE